MRTPVERLLAKLAQPLHEHLQWADYTVTVIDNTGAAILTAMAEENVSGGSRPGGWDLGNGTTLTSEEFAQRITREITERLMADLRRLG